MDMSYREKSAWISFFSILGIFGYYFIQVAGLSDMPVEQGRDIAIRLLGRAIVLIIVFEILVHWLVAASNKKDAAMNRDEREKSIEMQGNQYGYYVLSAGVMMVIGRILFLSYYPEYSDRGIPLQVPMVTAHILMFSFFLAELVRFGAQIFFYRRGY